jgi:hypothetical protein
MSCKTYVVDVITYIACNRGGRTERCAECNSPAGILCDWKLTGAKAGATCDRKLCEACARSVAPGKHLCPAHGRVLDKRQRSNGGSHA